jgi:hypothetical protein
VLLKAVLRQQPLAQSAGARRELAAVKRGVSEILKALSERYRSEAWKAELITLAAVFGTRRTTRCRAPIALSTIPYSRRREKHGDHKAPDPQKLRDLHTFVAS